MCWTRARIVDTLDEALDGVTHLCATAMVPRDFGPPTCTPREHLSLWPQPGDAARGLPVRLRALRHAQRGRLPLPCGAQHPDRAGFRLAEPGRRDPGDRLRMAPGAGRLRRRARRAPPAPAADAQAVAGMLAHWERALVDVGFLDPAAPKKLMPRLTPAVQPGAAHAGGNPHPAWYRQGHVEAARQDPTTQRKTQAIDCAALTT